MQGAVQKQTALFWNARWLVLYEGGKLEYHWSREAFEQGAPPRGFFELGPHQHVGECRVEIQPGNTGVFRIVGGGSATVFKVQESTEWDKWCQYLISAMSRR